MTFVRGADERRLPAPPLRDAAQAPAVLRPRVQHRPRADRAVGPAARGRPRPRRGGRRDARRRRHGRRLRPPDPRDDRRRRRPRRAAAPRERDHEAPPEEGRHLVAAGGRPPLERARAQPQGPRAVRVRRRRRRRAAAAAELRHPRGQGLRRVPDQRPVPQDHEPADRRRSTRPRSTGRPTSALPRCPCRTSTPASSTAAPRCCSARTPAGA